MELIEIEGQTYKVSATQFVYSGTLTSDIVVPGQVLLYGFTVSSTNSGSQYVQLHDAQTLPADGAVPIFFAPVASDDQVSGYYGSRGRRFTGGIVICNSSTPDTKTLGADDCLFDIQYARLLEDVTGSEY